MQSTIIEVNDNDLTALLGETKLPIFVVIWGNGCVPCDLLEPIIEDLAEEFQDKILFCKMNITDNLEMAIKYKIRSVPTILILQDGIVKGRIIGLHNKLVIKTIIETVRQTE